MNQVENCKEMNEETINNLLKNYEIPHLVSVQKTKPNLGLSIYGGVNTEQIVPRVTHVQVILKLKQKNKILFLNLN